MRIPITFQRVYAAPPEAVLHAIQRAGEWRESAVPPDLRADALLGVDARVSARRFRVAFDSSVEGLEPPSVAGRADAHAGGTRITVRCGRSRWGLVVPGILAAWLLVDWLQAGRVTLPLLLVVLVFGGVGMYHYTRLGRAGERQARYLLDRIDAALAPLPRLAAAPRADVRSTAR